MSVHFHEKFSYKYATSHKDFTQLTCAISLKSVLNVLKLCLVLWGELLLELEARILAFWFKEGEKVILEENLSKVQIPVGYRARPLACGSDILS